MTTLWNITVRIRRQRQDEDRPRWQDFSLEVDPDETVLDAVEKIWAFKDRTLTFRHACHHSTCGACGMRVNGVEKLTCITPVRSVTHNNGILKIEPLRNFPVVSDLVVDVAHFFEELEEMHTPQVVTNRQGRLDYEKTGDEEEDYVRLVDCIECGLCVSACPVALTDAAYVGPASLAGLQQSLAAQVNSVDASLADNQNGAWRCHSAYECSEVCPSHVEPGYRIMDLRKKIMQKSFRQWFGGREKTQ
ncbi:MAG: succinate dehydrogenase/fumarate reductase iron-sulfur subunit [Leptolinea sp.]|jgi:succinate dehydrogenase / fumarate reductase iron-sulfur subunit|nr:succinate dehydrogenase/fumarate reductase iron-sulfur subunit [Leptolinea sp.]